MTTFIEDTATTKTLTSSEVVTWHHLSYVGIMDNSGNIITTSDKKPTASIDDNDNTKSFMVQIPNYDSTKGAYELQVQCTGGTATSSDHCKIKLTYNGVDSDYITLNITDDADNSKFTYFYFTSNIFGSSHMPKVYIASTKADAENQANTYKETGGTYVRWDETAYIASDSLANKSGYVACYICNSSNITLPNSQRVWSSACTFVKNTKSTPVYINVGGEYCDYTFYIYNNITEAEANKYAPEMYQTSVQIDVWLDDGTVIWCDHIGCMGRKDVTLSIPSSYNIIQGRTHVYWKATLIGIYGSDEIINGDAGVIYGEPFTVYITYSAK